MTTNLLKELLLVLYYFLKNMPTHSSGWYSSNHKVYFEIPKSNIYLHLYIVAPSEVWGINFHYLNMTLALWGLLRYCLVILLTIENHCLPPSSSHTYIAFLIFKFIKLSNRDVAPIFTPTICWEKPLYNKVYKIH